MFSDIREDKKKDIEKTNIFILTLSSQEWLKVFYNSHYLYQDYMQVRSNGNIKNQVELM